ARVAASPRRRAQPLGRARRPRGPPQSGNPAAAADALQPIDALVPRDAAMNERMRDLFAVEPSGFVHARDALAKELRAAGREAEAKEVTALRRPTAAVWAVNQLARKNRAELEQFIDASDRVRHAQVRGASGDDLRSAMAAQRGALAKLEQAAAEV